MSETKVCSRCKRELPKNRNYFISHKKNGQPGFHARCRECEGKEFLKEVREGFKICTKCKRELPVTPQYFIKHTGKTKDGFDTVCKECMGSKFKPIPKEGYRICTQCGQELLANNDNFARNGSHGLASRCKKCTNEYSKIYYEENHDCVLAHCSAYYQEHKEQKKEYDKNYNIINRKILAEKCKPRSAKYWKSERGRAKKKMYSHVRRVMEKETINTLTIDEWDICKIYFNNQCAYCGEKVINITQDHVFPVSKGGSYVASNIIPACKSCNSSKRDKDLEIWYRQQDFFSEIRLKKIYKWTQLKPNSEIQQLNMF